MKSFIYRWLGSVGAVVGAVTGHIISKNTHAGYPVKLLLVAMLSGVLASIGARIGQRLDRRRSEASIPVGRIQVADSGFIQGGEHAPQEFPKVSIRLRENSRLLGTRLGDQRMRPLRARGGRQFAPFRIDKRSGMRGNCSTK